MELSEIEADIKQARVDLGIALQGPSYRALEDVVETHAPALLAEVKRLRARSAVTRWLVDCSESGLHSFGSLGGVNVPPEWAEDSSRYRHRLVFMAASGEFDGFEFPGLKP